MPKYRCQLCKGTFDQDHPSMHCGECSGRMKVEAARKAYNEALEQWVKADRKFRKAKRKRNQAAERYQAAMNALTRARYGL